MEKDKNKIMIYSVNNPGHFSYVQKDKYLEIKRVLIRFLPKSSPGLTQSEMMKVVEQNVDEAVFPDKSKSGWWMKSVQLDLEARGTLIRENTKPLRWFFDPAKKESIPATSEIRKPVKKAHNPMPDYIKNALLNNDLMREYEERAPYQRNDYIGWIVAAKREETRTKRLTQMLDELRDGGLYMNMEYKKGS